MRNATRFTVWLLLLAVVGCASSYDGSGGSFPTPAKEKYDATRFASFVVGTTTKAQVVEALGKPGLWDTKSDGTSYLMYSYIGPEFGAMYQSVSATFYFDPSKALTKIRVPKN